MAEKQNTPEIRFEGFTDPWEQRKLGDLISVYIAHAGPEEDVTVLTSSRDGIQKQEDHFGRLQQHDTSDWNLIPYGYCTYRNRSDDGLFTFNVNKVADRGIVSKFYPVFETPECDADFLVAYLNSSQEIRKKLFVLAVGTSQVVLSYGALKELSLLLPQNREQSAIANVLNHIDNLITLHQRKYDKLCTVKKSMLDKMFPKPGETEPEIRFEGFTDPWEQRKFSDMYVVNNERNANCELGYDRTLSIATMTFNGGNGAADDSLSNYKVIRIGDIAFEGHTNKVHAYGRFVLNDAGDGLMSPRFSCLRPIVEQRYSFWKYYIPREESMRPILVNATKSGTMMNELVPDDLMRESILVPCLAEQEVIGNSLSQLDHLITLHQRKLELLRNIKKSLLDRMFV